METFSGLAMRALDDEALGWFSRRLPWGSYGLLCHASLCAPSLGVALARWCRHHALLTLGEARLMLETHDGVARLSFHEARDFGAFREFCVVTHLRALHGYACWAIDSRIPLLESSFPFPAPQHRDALRADAPRRAAALRVVRAGVHRLRRAVPRAAAAPRRARAAHAAAAGPATHRAPLPARPAARAARAVKQVALAVGFRNEKNFSRAFRGWTGQSTAAYRRSATRS